MILAGKAAAAGVEAGVRGARGLEEEGGCGCAGRSGDAKWRRGRGPAWKTMGVAVLEVRGGYGARLG